MGPGMVLAGKTMILLDTIVMRNTIILDADIQNETVLMNAETGQYYTLTATSRAIWDMLKEPVRVRDLCASLAASYQTPLETVQADTLEFLGYLSEQRMIIGDTCPAEASAGGVGI